MKITNVYICFIILSIIINGCKKYDDTYKEFVEMGVANYAQKPDSVKVWNGRNRVKISWLILSDPSINKYKIYWDNRQDSLFGSIDRTKGTDTVTVFINDLEEGIHYFEIYLYDKYGNSSIKTEVMGNVRGKLYQESLLQRVINKLTYSYDQLEIEWSQSSSDLRFVELHYKNDKGDSVKLVLTADDKIDTIRNLNKYNQFKYRSGYLPDTLVVDTFYTDYSTVTFDKEQVLDKDKWELYPLENDVFPLHYASRPISRLWDGSTSSNPPRLDNPTLPQWITIDLGQQNMVLTKIKINFYSGPGVKDSYLYNLGIPKEFEIWGSNDPSMDGDWSKWTLLGHFIGEKPSGLPSGELTAEDISVGKEGLYFNFSDQNNAYRYIRLKTINTWLGPGHVDVWYSEMTLWGEIK